jgi:quercetin dioxygenase-like cupin family protein
MSNIYSGNARDDGKDMRGWIIGSFIAEGIRKQENFEVKWGMHQRSEARHNWITGEERTTVCILISGKFNLIFREQEVILAEAGDYAMWGERVDHRWKALEDSTVLTLRWQKAS